MSSTDLLNGPISGLPTYNVKNNPSIFNFNSVAKINYLRQLLLAISFNHVFFDVVQDLRNMGRAYYNKNPRKFCSTVELDPVLGFGGKRITLYLPASGGFLDNSIIYDKIDNVNTSLLMTVLQNNQLPVCWSNQMIPGTQECVNVSTTPENAPKVLTNNQMIIYYYIKNADFFTRTLQLLTNSFYIHSVQRFQCYKLVFPEDLYPGNVQERTFVVTNDFLKAVYSQYLRTSRTNISYKIPAPIAISTHKDYVLPTTTLTEPQLNHYMNNDTDSFNI